MKYIKLFEDLFEDNLQDFCDTYLAYLKDKGFNILVNRNEINIFYPIPIYSDSFTTNPFSWDEVSDHIIPFIHMLYKEYDYDKLKDGILFKTINGRGTIKSFDDVVNDDKFMLPSIPNSSKLVESNYKNIRKIIIKPSEG